MEGDKDTIAEQFSLIESELYQRIERTYVDVPFLPLLPAAT